MIDVPIQVKDALREGRLRKNYRFQVLNDDGTVDFTIDNDNLVSESVNIDERMCSGDQIKYGLCEGSSLEFQYFMPEKGQYEANKTYMRNDLVHSNDVTWRSKTDNNTGNSLVEGDYWAEWVKPNITGRQLKVFVDVEYIDLVTQYRWETQASIDTAYTVTGMSGECRLYTDLDDAWDFVYVTENGSTTQVYPTYSESGTIIELGDVSGRTLLVALPVIPAPRAELQLYVPHDEPTVVSHAIPMGYFTVKNCSRQASTGIIKAVCYNKLQSDYLDAKANNTLLESFDGDSSTNLFLYDIQRTLLKDYEITDRSTIPIPIPSEQSTSSADRIELDLYFSEGADIDTPLSGYLFNRSLRDYSPYTPQNIIGKETLLVFYTNNVTVTTTASQYWLLYSLKKHLNVFVNNLVEYITDLVYGARFKKNASATAALYSREEIALKLQNATNLIYIGIYSGGVFRSYSLLRDAEKQIDNISKLVHHENATIQFTFPYGIGLRAMGNEHGSGTTCYDVMGASLLHSYQYKYYINNTWTEETKTAPAPEIRFWDGSLYNGVINEILCIGDLVLSDAEKIPFTIGDIPEFTLREIISANYETQCQFGQLSRLTDLFSGVELNHSRLLPADTLYPDNALYPDGAQESAFRSQYSKLWADEGNVRKWRYLIITYKGLDENQQEKDFTLQRTVNADGTDDYNCSDNWLFRNLIWTAADIGTYADAMVLKMRDITWFPFEMWCAGLPYLETGDEIEIPLGTETYTSYILQRQLKGIQNLQDTYINGTLDIF